MRRIGLLRHFPVAQPFPSGWRTAAELHEWRERYDAADIALGNFDLGGIEWKRCLSSDLPRARRTAEHVFGLGVEETNFLREAEFTPFQTGNFRLPVLAWRWLIRLCWLTGHRSQRACRDDLQRRVQALADQLCAAEEDTLIVSHAGIMMYLSAELRKRGFRGPKLNIAKHATAYVHEWAG